MSLHHRSVHNIPKATLSDAPPTLNEWPRRPWKPPDPKTTSRRATACQQVICLRLLESSGCELISESESDSKLIDEYDLDSYFQLTYRLQAHRLQLVCTWNLARNSWWTNSFARARGIFAGPKSEHL
ncbi:hypothetical protein PGT21_022040 [Puccinia graminis f. sp. tritici]|uniref:Uncharacterized protein n=1 Tax=Puccinia graminis f. sp. tritici TaxID=56615 RepID=A0A5B0LU35_PUCGR|nr:hypothetical protein PGT21_022040 [Puccinia graminis f. sp. tritici]